MQSSKDIKRSLIEQLEFKGADVSLYIDLVDQYIENIKMIRQFQKDIKERGTMYKTISATGTEYEKENPAVKAIILYQKAGLAILQNMQLSTDKCKDNSSDEL